MKLLSAIVPCYNEEENVRCFYDEFMKNKPFFDRKGLDYELIFVDDGSGDGTAQEVRGVIAEDSRVHLISFSRNFGKEAAMYAGMQEVSRAGLRHGGHPPLGPEGGAAGPVMVRAAFLSPDQPDVGHGNRRRRAGLPADEAAGRGCHSVPGGV